ncbi:MAG: hypothetical protein Q8Q16_00585, partial [Betaproteobacteria bacterium]|nr:hypothetical protein [Betaproteobacteria bacterium]
TDTDGRTQVDHMEALQRDTGRLYSALAHELDSGRVNIGAVLDTIRRISTNSTELGRSLDVLVSGVQSQAEERGEATRARLGDIITLVVVFSALLVVASGVISYFLGAYLREVQVAGVWHCFRSATRIRLSVSTQAARPLTPTPAHWRWLQRCVSRRRRRCCRPICQRGWMNYAKTGVSACAGSTRWGHGSSASISTVSKIPAPSTCILPTLPNASKPRRSLNSRRFTTF